MSVNQSVILCTGVHHVAITHDALDLTVQTPPSPLYRAPALFPLCIGPLPCLDTCSNLVTWGQHYTDSQMVLTSGGWLRTVRMRLCKCGVLSCCPMFLPLKHSHSRGCSVLFWQTQVKLHVKSWFFDPYTFSSFSSLQSQGAVFVVCCWCEELHHRLEVPQVGEGGSVPGLLPSGQCQPRAKSIVSTDYTGGSRGVLGTRNPPLGPIF